MPKTKYSLPPIVLYESHADRSTTDFLINQLPKLKKAGYTTICVDGMVPEASLDEQITMMKTLINMQTKRIAKISPTSPEHGQESEKLRGVYAKLQLFEAMKEYGFKLGGIDLPATEQLKEKSLNSEKREQTLTTNTLKEVTKNDGGVVVVLGFGHCIFQQMIKNQDTNSDQYLWFHIHNPNNETRAHQELMAAYHQKGLDTYFPLGVGVFQSSDPKLSGTFWDKISDSCYSYDSEELGTSTSMMLKSMLGPDVRAHLRKDGQHHVDAIISINTATSHQENPSGIIQRIDKALHGKVKYEVTQVKENLQVIIRGINEPEVAEEIRKLSTNY
jgi:hypothetical protein